MPPVRAAVYLAALAAAAVAAVYLADPSAEAPPLTAPSPQAPAAEAEPSPTEERLSCEPGGLAGAAVFDYGADPRGAATPNMRSADAVFREFLEREFPSLGPERFRTAHADEDAVRYVLEDGGAVRMIVRLSNDQEFGLGWHVGGYEGCADVLDPGREDRG